MRGLDPTLPTLPQLPSASRVRGAYLVLPPAPFRGRSPPASPTSTPVFDGVIYSQRDGTRSYRTEAAAEKMDLFSWTRHDIMQPKRLWTVRHLPANAVSG